MDHFGFHRFRCLNKLLPISSANISPLVTTSALFDRAENVGSFGKRLIESERDAAERFLNRIEFALEEDAAFMKHRDMIGKPFNFIQ